MELYNPYVLDEESFEFKGWELIFDETFLGYFQLLKQRAERLLTLEIGSIDYITYTDICLVMIRALLVENERYKENYTLQNFLLKHNRPDLVETVNEFISQRINKITSLRDALKISVDKFIAHNDTIVFSNSNGEKEININDWFKRTLFLKDISSETYPFTIKGIISFIEKVLKEIELYDKTIFNKIAYGK